MSGIVVTFGTIMQAQSDVANTVAKIDSQLNDLRSFLAPMVSTWQGGAATDYQQLQRKWDAAAGDMNMVLGQISQMLGSTHDSYRETESRNAATWTA